MARIAVIGAGMGAMAAAARLAVAGHRVAVYERGRTHGGGVGRRERDGFAFDTGPGLLHLPAVYRDLFVKTGKETLEQCVDLRQVDPAAAHIFPGGARVALPNASRAGVVSALDAALGTGAGERWSELINRAREVWDATRRPLLEEPLRADVASLADDPYPALRRGWFPRGGPAPLAKVARRELADPRLAALLESHALAYGLDPRHAPASASVLAYMEQTFGSWYARGGMRALANALYERCLARRVEFAFDAEAVAVRTKGGRAAGVELANGSVIDADLVVAGVSPARLEHLLAAGATVADPALAATGPAAGAGVSGASAGRPGPGREQAPLGRFSVFLALRGARPAGAAHRTVVHSADRDGEYAALFPALPGRSRPGSAERAAPGAGVAEQPTVTVLRPDDLELVPDGDHEAVTLTAAARPHGAVDWARSASCTALAEEAADRLVTAAEVAVPGLRDRLLWREIRTPYDTAQDTGAATGGVPGPALAGAGGQFLAPTNLSRLPGLYVVGGWAHPGGGLAHAGMSGAMVAGLIIDGADWRGSQ
ncbi:phytoene desaturase family protein [Streptomyces zagrosensis]|uniref:Phytoene dehydrogenase-like protein n=1 Tax=Streptomyces zagrosensis TaxID=1042984 RepID=A0A7W9UW32_9ACTN|nr:NAD(P)/FAD-dependent oxidoreductase [Streptomyces zagrosensis]MBB5933465.1 phytoene dehydrogenase-like protein [Streptomyces zagrosensis]